MNQPLKTPIGSLANKVFRYLSLKRKYVVFGVLAVILAYAFGISLSSIFDMAVILLLFVVSSVSIMYKRYFRAPPAFELMTFSTVLVTLKFGLLTGVLFGALSQITAEILSGAIDAQIVIFVPARGLLALWTWAAIHFFGITSLFTLGMIAIVLYNLTVQPISFFMGDMQLKAKTIYYTIFYTVANFFVFSILSNPVSYVLGLS